VVRYSKQGRGFCVGPTTGLALAERGIATGPGLIRTSDLFLWYPLFGLDCPPAVRLALSPQPLANLPSMGIEDGECFLLHYLPHFPLTEAVSSAALCLTFELFPEI